MTDTPPVVSSVGGQTLEAIFWSIGETLSRLGEKWRGNPFTTLADLILAPTMAEVRAMTPQKIADHMIYHFTDVSDPCFDPYGLLIFQKGLSLFLSQGFMNGIDYFFRFRRSQEECTSENESWRKRAEDSEAAFALFQAQKKNELSFLGERIAALETKLAEDNSAAQAIINDLKAKLDAANARSKKAIQDHSNIQNELSSMKIKAELDLKALKVKLSHLTEEARAQYARAKDLLKSNLDVRAKFCRAKEQLCKYKEKARSFYR